MAVEMPTNIHGLFGHGNEKLGEVLTFSLPAIDTCPGASGLCKGCCYATRGRYYNPVVKRYLERNYELSKMAEFESTAIDLLNNSRRKRARLFRVHPSGDLYDETYARKWLNIIKQAKTYVFWLYTRSWRVQPILTVLEQMAKLPNLQLWFSCDNETGRPAVLPARVRMAYMMIDSLDEPRWDADLYFRDNPMRDSVLKHIRGTMVCPVENGVSHTTCDKCRICLTDPGQDPAKRTHGRFALPTVN